jgi:hypothetical protein
VQLLAERRIWKINNLSTTLATDIRRSGVITQQISSAGVSTISLITAVKFKSLCEFRGEALPKKS